MATVFQADTNSSGIGPIRPNLKITGLHIRNLKSVTTLDLPTDGLGWDGPMPDMVMVGGINGSGKTSLLNFLVDLFQFVDRYGFIKAELEFREFLATEAWVDFCISFDNCVDLEVRFIVGDEDFLDKHRKVNWFGFNANAKQRGGEIRHVGFSSSDRRLDFFHRELTNARGRDDTLWPPIVSFPSERRTLVTHAESYKSPGKLAEATGLVQIWTPPKVWKDTLEARLYSLRWEDLNAKEEGRIAEGSRFDAYHQAFQRFFEGRKRLKWHRAELFVETKSGEYHELTELSSGEKQVILFMGELLYRWRPGSLILIDEPELHLHESFQTRLWEALIDWQQERGGQVIIATQSGHLFRIAREAMKVVLGMKRS